MLSRVAEALKANVKKNIKDIEKELNSSLVNLNKNSAPAYEEDICCSVFIPHTVKSNGNWIACK